MRFLLTTDPGLEDVAAEEVAESLPGAPLDIRPYAFPGHIRVEAPTVDDLLRLTTIHHIVEIRGEAEARTLDDVKKRMAGIPFSELESAASFRVSSKLFGDRDFGKMDLQRAAGGVLHDRHGTPVSLENFELNICVDLYGEQLISGIQITRDSLGDRIKRAKPLRSAIKPTIAAAMIRLAGAHRGSGKLIDPMCGSGTIAIEAARINPALEVTASDWDGGTVEVARETIANCGLPIEPKAVDARHLGESGPDRFDYIVTNPPYGVRQAKRTSIARLYRSLLPSFREAIVGTGRIALIVVKYRAFSAALKDSGLRVADERVVDLGGIEARIFVLAKE
jgi:putative N6-adenine-specific DNA methylase/tRNA (guanine6-N2)-methyltransferase